MDADARALYDFGRIVVFGVGFALALLAYQLSRAITAGIDVHIPFVGRPFHGLAAVLEDSIVSWTRDAYQGAEAEVTAGLNGLLNELAVWLGLVLLLGLGVKAAFEYLWNRALQPLIASFVSPVRVFALAALAKVDAVPGQIERAYSLATSYAESVAVRAFDRSTAYADGIVTRAVSALRGEFSQGIDSLRHAEDVALTHAMQIAADGIRAVEQTAQQAVQAAASAEAAAVSEAERLAAAAEARAEAAASAALAQSQAAGQAALSVVESVAVTAEHDFETLQKKIEDLGLAGLVAAVPALATLVGVIAVESGLENAECRSKVKGICGTQPNAWAGLLAGIAAAGIALDFRDVIKMAVELEKGAAGALGKLAALDHAAADEAGHIIADAMLALSG